jgi:hypothetical protein
MALRRILELIIPSVIDVASAFLQATASVSGGIGLPSSLVGRLRGVRATAARRVRRPAGADRYAASA